MASVIDSAASYALVGQARGTSSTPRSASPAPSSRYSAAPTTNGNGNSQPRTSSSAGSTNSAVPHPSSVYGVSQKPASATVKSSAAAGAAAAARPASASDAILRASRGSTSGARPSSRSRSHSARVTGGSPNLNAAAAALAERQAMADMMAALRSSHATQCRCRTEGGGGAWQLTGTGSGKKDPEDLAEELRQARGAMAALNDQNRVLRTEKQRLEDELSKCRASLARAEEMLSGRESAAYRGSGPNLPSSSLVNKLREQLAAQQAQSETLKAQLDDLIRGTRATRVAELQAQVKAQDQELMRRAEMHAVMRRRMEAAEAQAAEALERAEEVVNKGKDAERLARLTIPLAALQHAVELNEVRASATHAILELKAETAPEKAAAIATGNSTALNGGGGGGGGAGGGAADGGQAALAALAAAGPQSLSSTRIRKTMAALGDAHRALFGQANLLAEIFPPGLTTEQLCMRAALRPATAGAPEVLRYLRHHVHRMIEIMTPLPGSRVEFVPEDEGTAGGATSGGWSSPSARRARNGRNAAVRTSGGGGGNMARAAGGKARGSGGGNASGGGAGGGGGGGAAAAADDYDPWAFVGELLDYVRWLRSLASESLAQRPELESGLEQVSALVATCQEEMRRVTGGTGAGAQQQQQDAA